MSLDLKKHYSSREVAAITGLSARQLQWWDARRLLRASVSPRRTEAGGFTERRYSPVDLFELVVLADLRRRGFSVARLRAVVDTLKRTFGVRLFDVVGAGAALTLLTDGREIFARTADGQFFNLLRAPRQPLLVVGTEGSLKEVTLRMRGKRKRRRVKTAPSLSGRSSRAPLPAAE